MNKISSEIPSDILFIGKGLTRRYEIGGQIINALDGVDLEVRVGEYLRLVGSSGSGKSTVLNIIAALDFPTEGEAITQAGNLAELSEKEKSLYRARHVGMIFQSFNLIPHRTALQNVEIGLLFLGLPYRERIKKSTAILERVGLGARTMHRPSQLSGGERQRVAIARALVRDPSLLLADEPTGNLDQKTSLEIEELLKELHSNGLSIVLVTHDHDLALDDTNRTICLEYGRVLDAEGK